MSIKRIFNLFLLQVLLISSILIFVLPEVVVQALELDLKPASLEETTRFINLCQDSAGDNLEDFHVLPEFTKNGVSDLTLAFKTQKNTEGFKCQGQTKVVPVPVISGFTEEFNTKKSSSKIDEIQVGIGRLQSETRKENIETLHDENPLILSKYYTTSTTPDAMTMTSMSSENENDLKLKSTESEVTSSPDAPVHRPSSFYFTEEGYFVYEDDIYSSNEFCVTRYRPADNQLEKDTSFTVTLCIADCTKSICLNKCCVHGQAFDYSIQRCSYSGTKAWKPPTYAGGGGTNKTEKFKPLLEKVGEASELNVHMKIMRYPENCPGDWLRIPSFNRDMMDNFGFIIPKAQFRIQQSGGIGVFRPDQLKWVELDDSTHNPHLCVDGVQNYGEGSLYNGNPDDNVLIQCLPPPDQWQAQIAGREYYYGPINILVLFLSSTFLLVTIFVYYLTMQNEKFLSVHGWTVLCQLTTMFFTYFFLGTSHLLSLFPEEGLSSNFCIFNGILSHFFTLSTFFWMTVLDYDIWTTFRSIKSCRHSKGIKNLPWYMTFAIGVPGTIILVSLLLEKKYRGTNSGIITPNYGIHTCYISKEALGYYVYYIIGFLICFNFVLISLTLRNIYKARASTQMVLQKTRAAMKQQQSSFVIRAPLKNFLALYFGSEYQTESLFKLFAKLLVIMGVTWIFDVTSWIFSEEIRNSQFRFAIRLTVDIVNYLQPVAIFTIFVCKKKTAIVLAQRFTFIRREKPDWVNSWKKSSISQSSRTSAHCNQRSATTKNIDLTVRNSSSSSRTPSKEGRQPQIGHEPLITAEIATEGNRTTGENSV